MTSRRMAGRNFPKVVIVEMAVVAISRVNTVQTSRSRVLHLAPPHSTLIYRPPNPNRKKTPRRVIHTPNAERPIRRQKFVVYGVCAQIFFFWRGVLLWPWCGCFVGPCVRQFLPCELSLCLLCFLGGVDLPTLLLHPELADRRRLLGPKYRGRGRTW